MCVCVCIVYNVCACMSECCDVYVSKSDSSDSSVPFVTCFSEFRYANDQCIHVCINV